MIDCVQDRAVRRGQQVNESSSAKNVHVVYIVARIYKAHVCGFNYEQGAASNGAALTLNVAQLVGVAESRHRDFVEFEA